MDSKKIILKLKQIWNWIKRVNSIRIAKKKQYALNEEQHDKFKKHCFC